MKSFPVLLLCLSILYVSSAFADVNFYVDGINGNDTSTTGSSDEPFKTLLRAEQVAFITENSEVNTLVDIYVAPGVYSGTSNVGVNYRNSTRIIYWNRDDSETTELKFDCGSSLEQDKVYFNASNNFIINGANSDKEISTIVSNCATGILVSSSLSTPVNLQVFSSIFNENKLAISAVNIESVMIQSSNFTNSPPAGNQVIVASGKTNTNSSFQIVDDVYFSNVGVVVIDNFVSGKISGVGFTGGNKGAFAINGGSWDIDSLSVSAVSSAEGGALFLAGSAGSYAKADIVSSSFTSCSATANGGGIYFRNVDASLSDVSFTSCTALESGGGIYFYNSSRSSLEDCTFTRNSAAFGGGIELFGSIHAFSISGLVFNNNSAYTDGSCLDCCQGAGNCGTVVNATVDAITGAGNLDVGGAQNVTCTLEEDDFSTAVSVTIDTNATYAGSDNGTSTWWIWLIIAIVAAVIIAVIAGGIAYFIYQKKRNGYTRVE